MYKFILYAYSIESNHDIKISKFSIHTSKINFRLIDTLSNMKKEIVNKIPQYFYLKHIMEKRTIFIGKFFTYLHYLNSPKNSIPCILTRKILVDFHEARPLATNNIVFIIICLKIFIF